MSAQSTHVLLVEDDEDDYVLTRDLLDEIMENAYDLRWVTSVEEGIKALREQEVDVCLTDYRIGERTGLEFVSEVSGEQSDVPFILLTGLSDYEVDVAATKAGAADYLEKSALTPGLLERSIRYAISHNKNLHALKDAQESLKKAKDQLEIAVRERTAELSEAKEQLTDAVESISEGFALWDGDNRLIMCNERYRELYPELRDVLETGIRFEEFIRFGYERGVFSETEGDRDTEIQRRLVRHRESISAFEQELGEDRWVRVSKRRTKTGHIVCILSDISERKRSEATIKRMAQEDALTKLPNRALFQTKLEEAIASAGRTGRLVGLMLLDLDHFKNINDTLGHPAGDELLRQVSERLLDCVRTTDTVARLGGDEFAVIANNIESEDGVITLAQRIIRALTSSFQLNDQEIHTGSSVGITIYPNDKGNSEQLMRNADFALYRAKEGGRGTFQLYDEEMNAKAQARRALEADLREALNLEQFHVVYQPQFDIRSGQVVGAEALIRWTHPERGPVSPGDFIPLAESTRLIIPISEWVLRTVCKQLRQWQNCGLARLRASVNMSPLQFKQSELIAQLTGILEEAGLDPRWLELEITEGIAMEAGDEVLEILTRLNKLGVTLAIDDFGTGFSSLNRLKEFPVHRIKIDQSFVRDLTTDANDAAISTAVVHLGHSLNLRVIAEGVETVEQLDFLAEHGCDEFQGYLLSKPLPPKDFEAFLSSYDTSQFPGARKA